MTPPTGRATVVVTGGTKGLGRELALAFARQGNTVLALYRSDRDAAAQLARALDAEQLDGSAVQYDVASADESTAVWSRREITDAAALTLVHNAGAAFAPTPMHLLTWRDFDACLGVSLRGGWHCVRALLKPMLACGHGQVIGVLSSAAADMPPKGFAAYAAAKSALRSLVQSVAVEYGARGVKAFTASPGFMDTPLTAAWHPALRAAVLGAGQPADPASVASRIVALAEGGAAPAAGEDYPV